MKTAVIIGVNGQDGQFLYNYLLDKNYSIIGFDIKYIISSHNQWEEELSINNYREVEKFIKSIKPDEIYYLAAFHHSSEEDISNEIELVNKSYEVNVLSYVNILEAIRLCSGNTRIFYAASCHIFGSPIESKQNENTDYNPQSIYAITKYSSMKISEYYRNKYSSFISIGILYNHESHLRPDKFVSRKIVKTALEIQNKIKKELVVGNLNSDIDWGYAGDFVEAYVKILNYKSPDTFVVATGATSKLKDFIKYVFDSLDLDWKNYVKQDELLLKRKIDGVYCGDYSKLSEKTGWKPKVNLRYLAELMVKEEIKQKNYS